MVFHMVLIILSCLTKVVEAEDPAAHFDGVVTGEDGAGQVMFLGKLLQGLLGFRGVTPLIGSRPARWGYELQ